MDASSCTHTCQVKADGSSPNEEERCLPSCDRVHDARGEMRTLCEDLALSELDKTSITIANEVVAVTAMKYEAQSKFLYFC